MTGFLLRLAISALGLWMASKLVPGLHFAGTGSLLLAAFLLGVVNAFVRPLVILLTLPLTILTLGLFLLIVNGLMLALVAWLLPGFSLDGLVPAVLGAIVAAVTAWLASAFIGPSGRFEVLVARREIR
jgi:putative membrane protein